VAYWNIRSISGIHAETESSRARLSHMALRLASARLLVFKILGTLDPMEMDRHKARFDTEKAYLEKALHSAGVEPGIIADTFQGYAEIISLQYNFSLRTARKKIDQESKRLHDRLVKKLGSLSQEVQQASEKKIAHHYRQSIDFTLGLLAAALVIAMVLAVVLSKSLIDRQQAGKELMDSEARYRRLAENSPDMIYRIALPDGRYEYVSPGAEKITGYPPRQWYDTPLLIKKIMHPDWQTYFDRQMANLLEGKVPPTYDYRIVHKDGRTRFIAPEAVAAIRAEGHYTFLYAGTERLFCPWSISETEKRLDPGLFLRTHRSYLVNKRLVSGFERKKDTGVCLFEGVAALARVPVSRSRLLDVRQQLGV